MKGKNIINIIIISVFLIFVIWKFSSNMRKADKLYDKLEKEYGTLTIEDSVDNFVLKKYYPSNWRGGGIFHYVIIDDNRKFHLKINKCITYKEIYLDDILKSGVKLQKKIGNDTLVIINNSQKYLFIIDETL